MRPADGGRDESVVEAGMNLADVAVGAPFARLEEGIDLTDVDVGTPARRRPEPPGESLTPREVEVLGLIAQGCTNRMVAERLTLSVGTVRVHVQHILGKLGVADRTGAVVRGMERGWIPVPEERR